MSEDETVTLIACVIVGLWLWGRWFWRLLRMPRVGRGRLVVGAWKILAPAACLVVLIAVLRLWSSWDVRSDFQYLAFYTLMGAAWVALALWPVLWLGIDLRGDIDERHNPAAMIAASGILLGLTTSFAGANIGDGPGWWVVVFCAGGAGVTWYALWLLYEWVGQAAEKITVERDVAGGWRLAGMLTACGLVLGRSVAGNWHGADQAVIDLLQQAWPLAPAVLVAAGLERLVGATPGSGVLAAIFRGVTPALVYVALAGGYLVYLGPWS